MTRGILETFLSRLRQVTLDRWIIVLIVPALLIISFLLPPLSLGNRLFHWGEPLVTPEKGGEVSGPYGARLVIAPEAVTRSIRLRLEALDVSQAGLQVKNADFITTAAAGSGLATLKANGPEAAALRALPEGILPFNPVFRLTIWGKSSPRGATFTLPIPYALPIERADLYGWDGSSWQWLPSTKSADGLTLTANLTALPQLVMLAEGLPQTPEISLGVEAGTPASLGETNADRLSISRLVLGDGAGLLGEASLPQDLGKPALLTISNERDGVLRSDLVDNLIIDPAQRSAHIKAILAHVSNNGWSGVDLDYRGVDAALRNEFSAFVSELAQALHSANRSLVVRVDVPSSKGDGWDTGAYDWAFLGQVADRVRIPAFADPAAYAEGGAMERLLAWATNIIARQKIELMLTTSSQDVAGETSRPITYRQALAKLAGAIRPQNAAPMMLPGQSLRFGADDPALLAVTLDEPSQTYWFRYKDEGGRLHTVWLANGMSTLRKLQYVSRYALGGVFLEDAFNPENDESIALIVENMEKNPQPTAPQFAYVWTVQTQTGQTVGQQVVPLDRPDFVWTASNQPGQYVIGGAISDDGGKSTVENVVKVPVLVPSPTFTPTPTNTPTPTPTNTPTPTPTATPKPTAAPQAAAQAQAVVAPRGGVGFAYGIQAHIFGDDQRIYDHIKALGFTWVKQQVEWFRYNPAPGVYNWGDLDRIVDGATANGLNILFSVVKAPDWARGPGADHSVDGPPQNLQTFADFMGAMAARYKGRVKAYEIWNEQNLHYEWGNEPLDPGRYVAMLKLAYNAIKAADPSAYVISGALTPTGAPPPLAMDDFTYLELMYQAGLKNYCDGVGVHPSGYNVPPDAPWPGYTDPSASFRGPFDGGSAWHHSWSFKATMEGYRNIMVKYGDSGKRLWPTEFGWASVENLGAGPAPGYGYAADNTEAEQAQFIVRAYQMAKNWGWVGPMFLWNLNFAPASGRANEKAAFGIVREDWSPRPAFHALAGMPK